MSEHNFDPYGKVPTATLVGTVCVMLYELTERAPFLTPYSHEVLRGAMDELARAQRGWAPIPGQKPATVLRLVPKAADDAAP